MYLKFLQKNLHHGTSLYTIKIYVAKRRGKLILLVNEEAPYICSIQLRVCRDVIDDACAPARL